MGIETETGVPIDEWVADGTGGEDASDVVRRRVHDDAELGNFWGSQTWLRRRRGGGRGVRKVRGGWDTTLEVELAEHVGLVDEFENEIEERTKMRVGAYLLDNNPLSEAHLGRKQIEYPIVHTIETLAAILLDDPCEVVLIRAKEVGEAAPPEHRLGVEGRSVVGHRLLGMTDIECIAPRCAIAGSGEKVGPHLLTTEVMDVVMLDVGKVGVDGHRAGTYFIIYGGERALELGRHFGTDVGLDAIMADQLNMLGSSKNHIEVGHIGHTAQKEREVHRLVGMIVGVEFVLDIDDITLLVTTQTGIAFINVSRIWHDITIHRIGRRRWYRHHNSIIRKYRICEVCHTINGFTQSIFEGKNTKNNDKVYYSMIRFCFF